MSEQKKIEVWITDNVLLNIAGDIETIRMMPDGHTVLKALETLLQSEQVVYYGPDLPKKQPASSERVIALVQTKLAELQHDLNRLPGWSVEECSDQHLGEALDSLKDRIDSAIDRASTVIRIINSIKRNKQKG